MVAFLRSLGSILTFVGVGATLASAETAPLGALSVADVTLASRGTRPGDATPRSDGCIPADKCCKICSKGKACGNTCIRRSYECHVGHGCACDADEVCE